MTEPPYGYEAPRMTPERTAQLRAALVAEASRSPRSRRRWHLSGAALAAGAVLAVSGTAIAWVAVLNPDDPHLAYCSPEVTLDEDIYTTYGIASVDGPDGAPLPLDAIDVCGQMWAQGTIAPTTPGQSPGTVPPELTACVVEGSLVVYPGGKSTCEQLGVPLAADQ
jgi:hypothetical protein